jgi:hypothetical protein
VDIRAALSAAECLSDMNGDRFPVSQAIEDLRFTPRLLTKPAPRGLTVETTLQHFAIVTYWVDPVSLWIPIRPAGPRFIVTIAVPSATGASR